MDPEEELTCRQGVTARPGARFGPRGIRQGSQRIQAGAGWSIYTGKFSIRFQRFALFSMQSTIFGKPSNEWYTA